MLLSSLVDQPIIVAVHAQFGLDQLNRLTDGANYDQETRSLHQLHTVADVAVVSAANESAIASEWARYGLATHADVIFGQEVGSKANSIASMLACGYESRKVVMVGDAMGDAQAAAANGVSFVPILPGREAESWRRLQEEALPKLLHGTFSPEYQATLLAQLRSVLHG